MWVSENLFLTAHIEFTPINSELRNFSSDKMTLNFLIIKYLKCHLSFVIFAFTLSMQQFASCLWVEFLRDEKCSIFEKFCLYAQQYFIVFNTPTWRYELGIGRLRYKTFYCHIGRKMLQKLYYSFHVSV